MTTYWLKSSYSFDLFSNYRTGGRAPVTRDRTTRNERPTCSPSRSRTSQREETPPIHGSVLHLLPTPYRQRQEEGCSVSKEQGRTASVSVFYLFMWWERRESILGKTNSVGTVSHLTLRMPTRPRVHLAASSVRVLFRLLG